MLVVLPVSAIFYGVAIVQNRFKLGGRTFFVLWDDAMTTMVYSRNLATGQGPVWSSAQPHVEGYTSTLWMLVLALLQFVFRLPDRLAALPVMILGAIAMLVVVVLTDRLSGELGLTNRARWFVVVSVASFWPLAYWCLRGTEVSLVTVLSTALLLCALKLRTAPGNRQAVLFGVLAAALCLTRDDMLPFVLIVGLFAASAIDRPLRARAVALIGAPIVVVIAAHELFRIAYYGYPLPNAYYLKMTGIPISTRLERGAIWQVTMVFAELAPALAFAACALFRGRNRARLMLGATVVVQLVYAAYVGGDIAERLVFADRFVTPAVVPLLLLAAMGVEETLSWSSSRALGGVALGLCAIGSFVGLGGLARLPLEKVNHSIEAIPLPAATQWYAWTFGIGLLLLAAVAFPQTRRLMVVPTMVAVIGASSGYALQELRLGGAMTGGDSRAVALGLALREYTSPQDSVAVATAGDVTFFARRDTYDLLGKSDNVIAHGRARGAFVPGHNKWDYGWSVGHLRPTLIAEIWFPTNQDLADFKRWGYRGVTDCSATLVNWNIFMIRRGASGVRLPGLARYVRRTHPCPQT